MGACGSSPSMKTDGGRSRGGGGGGLDSIRRPIGSIVIQVDGRMQELKQPSQAKHITSQNPNCFLCSSEFMSVGTCLPHVPDDEELQPGQIYFLLPLHQAHNPLSLHDLCNLAIKASSALGKQALNLSKLNFQ